MTDACGLDADARPMSRYAESSALLASLLDEPIAEGVLRFPRTGTENCRR